MKLAVVVCGRIGSGKSTAVDFIAAEFGFKAVSFGSYIRHMAALRGRPSTRGPLHPPVHRKRIQLFQGHQCHATGDLGADAPVTVQQRDGFPAGDFGVRGPVQQQRVVVQVNSHQKDIVRLGGQAQVQIVQCL